MARKTNYFTLIAVTPTLDTSEYVTGDRFGSVMKLPDVLLSEAGRVELMSSFLVDKTGSDATIDIIFFNDEPTTISADNTPFTIDDDELMNKYIGALRLGCTISTGTQRVGSYGGSNLVLQGAEQCGKGRDLWAAAIIRDTATFAVDSVTYKFGFMQV